jgi:DNA-binding IclR family transcriptional regulator
MASPARTGASTSVTSSATAAAATPAVAATTAASPDKAFVTVGSVVHALNILRLLAREPSPLGVTAIARAVGVSPSSCFNLLKTLCAEGMAEFEPDRKTYRLGPGVSVFARDGVADPALALMRPRLMAMAAQYRFASGLWRVSGAGRMVLVDFADSELATRIHMTVGQRLPLLSGAMGRCVAAHSDLAPLQIAQALGEMRWVRPPSQERYRKEVAEALRRGWAVDDGDFLPGICTIAAPVLDGAGRVRYCIANTFFSGEHTAKVIARIGAMTAVTAREVSGMLYPAG